MLSNIIALTAGFAATASAFQCEGNYFSFFNRGGDAMSYQRLDPGLFPGIDSPHLHTFDGGNGLSASVSAADLQASTCTTARVKTDKSLYWRPTLFFNNGAGFTRVPEKSTKIYYKFGDGDHWANVTAFPEGFNMIAGDPMKRSDGNNPGGVRWGCHQPDGNGAAIFAQGFPKGFSRCDYGFASEVTFPTCWNGEQLNPKNPNAHMAYPNSNNGVGIENCPTTHRAARFPTLFIEFWYDVAQFNGQYGPDDTPWTISNGDPTGFGFHADFMNGWEKGVLEKAIGETGGCNCGCACGQTEIEQCFGKENVNDDSDAAWASCSAQGAYASEAAPVVEKLPGCNPLQAGPERATAVSGADCSATNQKSVPSSAPAISQASTLPVQSALASGTPLAVDSTVPVAPEAIIPSSSSSSSRRYRFSRTSTAAVPNMTTGLKNRKVHNHYNAHQAAAPSSDDQDCQSPVYVTVTPTVFVTLTAPLADATMPAAPFANATVPANAPFANGTAPATVSTITQTTTITIGGYGAIGTGAY